MSAPSRLRKTITILLMAVLVLESGCRGWIERPIVPDTGAIPRREALRVTKSDGKVIFLGDSFITSDSIFGFLAAIPYRRTAIALVDVTKIQRRVDTTPKGLRIAEKVYLGVVGVALTAVLVTGFMYGIAASRQ